MKAKAEQVKTPKRPASDAEFAASETRSVLWRCRRVFAPFWVMAGMTAAVELGRLAGWTFGRPVAVSMVLSVAAGIVGLLGFAAGCRVVPRRLRWRLALACGFAVGWLIASAWRGVDWTGATVLVGGGWAVSAYWLRVNRPGVPTAIVEAISRNYGRLWAENIARPNGVAPGSRVLSLAPVLDQDGEKIGVALTVELVAGDKTIEALHAQIKRIAGGLKTRVQNLVIEDIIEQDPDEDDPNLIRVQIITKSPIRQTVFFTEPRWRDGEIVLGPYADGVGEATFRLYTRKSMWGGYVLGSTGSGKSRLLEAIALVARAMGDTVIVYIDGQDGASSPTLKKHADWFGGRSEAPDMLAALERIYADRNAENIDRDLTGFTPSPQRPGLLVIIDECHAIFADRKRAARWGDLSRAGRKVGIGILASSQAVDLKVFGGDGALRDSLYMGNKIVLHVESKESPQLVTGLEMNPADLPAHMPGYGYTVQSPESGGRTAPFRGYFLPDNEDAEQDPSIPVPTLEQWMWQIPPVGLDVHARSAAGDAFADRAKVAREKREQWQARRRGELGWDEETEPAPEPTAEFTAPTFGSFSDPNALTEPQQRLLGVIADGVDRPKAMREATGLSETRIRQLLGELVERGLIQRAGHGRYQPVTVEAAR